MSSRLDQSLYYIIGNSFLRIIGAHQEDPDDAFKRLKKMRPRPSNYVAWGEYISGHTFQLAFNKSKVKLNYILMVPLNILISKFAMNVLSLETTTLK